MADKKPEVIEVKVQPGEPLEHRCACGIMLWAALKRQDLPAPGIVHTCPECSKKYVRVNPKVNQAPAAVDKKQ